MPKTRSGNLTKLMLRKKDLSAKSSVFQASTKYFDALFYFTLINKIYLILLVRGTHNNQSTCSNHISSKIR